MITLVDAGGRLQQRRKWSQCLVDASVVVLCVSLTDYDRYMRWTSADNQPMTAIHDSLLIAEELATRMMRHVPLFVVFTKYDLLQPKLAAGSSIKSAFTDYTGPEDSQQHIIDYLRALFVKATRGGDVRFHTCNGLDMNEVVRLWNELVGVVSK